MPKHPAIPSAAALAAATADVYERTTCSTQMAWRIAAGALTSALPHLLPGLFVAPDGGGCLTIWAQGADGATERPSPQMVRTQDNAALFDAVVALLPREE